MPHDWLYFIVNTGEERWDGWVPLARKVRAASYTHWTPLGPLTLGAAVRPGRESACEVYLQLAPEESLLLHGLAVQPEQVFPFRYERVEGTAHPIEGEWSMSFIAGGPTLPAARTTTTLGSWATLGDETTERFAGTVLYSIRFDAPPGFESNLQLDLGRVAQSARVRLNGRPLGTAFTAPFHFRIGSIQSKDNLLEIEITSTAANRIRDLDRRQVEWRKFHDINFVNIDYKPFDASVWPLADAGLLGPVTLVPVEAFDPSSL